MMPALLPDEAVSRREIACKTAVIQAMAGQRGQLPGNAWIRAIVPGGSVVSFSAAAPLPREISAAGSDSAGRSCCTSPGKLWLVEAGPLPGSMVGLSWTPAACRLQTRSASDIECKFSVRSTRSQPAFANWLHTVRGGRRPPLDYARAIKGRRLQKPAAGDASSQHASCAQISRRPADRLSGRDAHSTDRRARPQHAASLLAAGLALGGVGVPSSRRLSAGSKAARSHATIALLGLRGLDAGRRLLRHLLALLVHLERGWRRGGAEGRWTICAL